MARYTITPWRYHRDLLEVRDQLYRRSQHPPQQAPDATSKQNQNPPADLRRHAVDRVLAWKLRGNLPHAVESTALIVDAFLHHEAASSPTKASPSDSAAASTPATSDFALRAVYTAAFTRFVTGFCDIGRARERASLAPSSMLEIARQIAMPDDFVALRHEATHEGLPALGRLVKACERALEWCWDVYWSKLGEEGVDVEGGGEGDVEAVRQILRTYRTGRREAFRSQKRKRSAREEDEVVQAAKNACIELGYRGGRGMWKLVLRTLQQDRLMVPSDRGLGSSMDGAFLIWDDLLLELSHHHRPFAGDLLRSLLDDLFSTSAGPGTLEADPTSEALMLWALHLVESDAWKDVRGASLNGKTAQTLAMKHCCVHPGYWSQQLGEKLLRGADGGFRDLWQPIFEASRLQTGENAAVRKALAGAGSEAIPMDRSPDAFPPVQSAGWFRAALPPTVPIGIVS